MKPIAGLLNQKIVIYRYEDVPNDSGGTDPQEVEYWATSAEVKFLRASKTLEANQEKLKPVATFKVRYRNDKEVIPDMILKWRNEVFTVVDVEIDYVYKQQITIKGIANATPIR